MGSGQAHFCNLGIHLFIEKWKNNFIFENINAFFSKLGLLTGMGYRRRSSDSAEKSMSGRLC